MVGVGRSGGVVATILAGCLGSRRVLVVDTDIDRETDDRPLYPESEAALKSIPRDFKVLIATADVLKGASVRKVSDTLPETVERKIAALFCLPGASPKPDFLISSGPTPPE